MRSTTELRRRKGEARLIANVGGQEKGKIDLTEFVCGGPLPGMSKPTPETLKEQQQQKEARLAAALRTNLRRRKAASRPPAAKDAS
jgi:hypothetical protein